MKKTVATLLALSLSVCLLAACGSRRAAPAESVASAGNAADDIPVETPLPTDAPTPEPPVETYVAAPNPVPTGDETLRQLLISIRDDYRPGTAGSTLVADRIAAEILDWYASVGSVNLAYETAAALGDPGADAAGMAYMDKLYTIYGSAIRLYGYYGCQALESAGYPVEEWEYSVATVREVFDGIYSGFGQGAGLPPLVRIYRPNDDAQRFMTVCGSVRMLSPEELVAELVENGVLAEGVAIQAMNYTETGLHIDMNDAFLTQLRSMGTSGEYMLMGSLVNTFLDNYTAGSILVTVNGAVPESGHVIYDFPLTFFADNVAAE